MILKDLTNGVREKRTRVHPGFFFYRGGVLPLILLLTSIAVDGQNDALIQRNKGNGKLFFIKPMDYSTKGWGRTKAPFDHTFVYREDSANSLFKVNFTLTHGKLKGKPEKVRAIHKDDSLAPEKGPELFYVERDGNDWKTRLTLRFDRSSIEAFIRESEHHYILRYPKELLKFFPKDKTLEALRVSLETIHANLPHEE